MEKILTFGEGCINKNKFHMHKKPIIIDGIYTKKVVLSKKELYGNKYFIGYDDYNDGIITLYIRLPPMNALPKCLIDSKHINLLICDKELLKNIMQYGIKLVVYLKKNLILNHCIKTNT